MGFESSRAGNCSETPTNEIAPCRSGTTEFYHSGEQLPRSTSLLRAAVYALERLGIYKSYVRSFPETPGRTQK